MRDMLFVSHANAEDNEFAFWISLQLAKQGYPVWCDLTKLLGGETFWSDIEHAVRERTAKFLYVLSRTSNAKDGPLNELHVASNVKRDHKLHDFIIPLLIDDLPHREIQIQISRLTTIDFARSWAVGLKQLLKKLEDEGVPKKHTFSPAAVTEWWRGQNGSERALTTEPDDHLSNWFAQRVALPPIFVHNVAGWPNDEQDGSGLDTVDYPAIRHDRFIVSFVETQVFQSSYEIENTTRYNAEHFVQGSLENCLIDRKQSRNIVVFLLRDAWERLMRARELPDYQLSNHARCFWFQRNAVSEDTLHFTGINGRKASRQVVGFKSLSANKDGISVKRPWHFAFQAKAMVYPFIGYCLKPHVLFTDDGFTIWESKERLHKARRSQCSMWWNPKWRDLLLATMSHLSRGNPTLSIPVAPNQALEIGILPLAFTAPVSFEDHPLPSEEDGVMTDESEDEDEDEAKENDE